MFSFRSQVIRKIKSSENEIFLTFDDGPCPEFTPIILDLLKKESVHASFFVVGEKCRQSPKLVERILSEGHSIFSHSLNHEYKYFFKSEKSLKHWMRKSLAELEIQTHCAQKIFRPPAGVLTPPLIHVAKELDVTLVLWNHRFYDSVFSWTLKKAKRSIEAMSSGDIILLHDWQKPIHRENFLKTLQIYIQELRSRSYRLVALTQSHIEREV